jgi:hypothetical protein
MDDRRMAMMPWRAGGDEDEYRWQIGQFIG